MRTLVALVIGVAVGALIMALKFSRSMVRNPEAWIENIIEESPHLEGGFEEPPSPSDSDGDHVGRAIQ